MAYRWQSWNLDPKPTKPSYHHLSIGHKKNLNARSSAIELWTAPAVHPTSVALLQHRHGCDKNIVTVSSPFFQCTSNYKPRGK